MRRDIESLTALAAVAAIGWLIVQFDKGQKESLRRAIANVVRPLAAYIGFTLIPLVAIAMHETLGAGFVTWVFAVLILLFLLWLLMKLVESVEHWADEKPKSDHKKT